MDINWYFVGAGLAQLLTLDLELGTSGGQLPSSAKITALCYGSPPVFTADPQPVLGNIFIVQNTDDALSGKQRHLEVSTTREGSC